MDNSAQSNATMAIVVGLAGCGAAYMAWRKYGPVWAGSIGFLTLVMALAIYAWPSAKPIGEHCKEDSPCPQKWEGALEAYIPCNKETGTYDPISNETTAPCKVTCPEGKLPCILQDGTRTCCDEGFRQCQVGSYVCKYVGGAWKAYNSLNGGQTLVEVPGNLDDGGKLICGNPDMQLPDGFDPAGSGSELYRICDSNQRWTPVGEYSGWNCQAGYHSEGYSCKANQDGRICNPGDPYSGRSAENACADSNQVAEIQFVKTPLGPDWPIVRYVAGGGNLGATKCTYPCQPDGKSYASRSKSEHCNVGPRCLAYAVCYNKVVRGPYNYQDDKDCWISYMAFFLMEDNTLRWIAVQDDATPSFAPKPMWDELYRHEGATGNLKLPLSSNWSQLKGAWVSDKGDRMVLNMLGTVKNKMPDASNVVFSFSGMSYPFKSAYDRNTWQLIVHDNIYGQEAWLPICFASQPTLPLFGGWRDKNLTWRQKYIPDSDIDFGFY